MLGSGGGCWTRDDGTRFLGGDQVDGMFPWENWKRQVFLLEIRSNYLDRLELKQVFVLGRPNGAKQDCGQARPPERGGTLRAGRAGDDARRGKGNLGLRTSANRMLRCTERRLGAPKQIGFGTG